MIVVRLMGGMGNQLFQYAAGRSLAAHHGTDLAFDLSWFRKQGLRGYELSHFNTSARVASPRDLKRFLKRNRLLNWFFKQIQFLRPQECRSYFVEKSYYHVDPAFFRTPKDVYLDGYWQNANYFRGLEAALRREFSLRNPPSGENERILREIQNTNSVSIHIRRGDFAVISHTRSYHGVCPVEYYQKAIELIIERVPNPRFLVFSDDPRWAKENLPLSSAEVRFVTHNPPDQAHEDLRLMVACRHHVIANSSFSWWGAWLGENAEQVAIAPRRWINAPHIDSSGLFPERWLVL